MSSVNLKRVKVLSKNAEFLVEIVSDLALAWMPRAEEVSVIKIAKGELKRMRKELGEHSTSEEIKEVEMVALQMHQTAFAVLHQLSAVATEAFSARLDPARGDSGNSKESEKTRILCTAVSTEDNTKEVVVEGVDTGNSWMFSFGCKINGPVSWQCFGDLPDTDIEWVGYVGDDGVVWECGAPAGWWTWRTLLQRAQPALGSGMPARVTEIRVIYSRS